MNCARPLALAFGMTLLLGGCAAPSGYPSLTLRPAESQSVWDTPTPAPSPSATPISAELSNRIDSLTKVVQDAAMAFSDRESAVRDRITAAKGSARGSQPWLDAQVALGELDLHHSATRDAASVIDTLKIDRLAAEQSIPPKLDAADKAAWAEVERQEKIMSDLAAQIDAAP